MRDREYHPDTHAVRGRSRRHRRNQPVATPIYQTSTFEVSDVEEQIRAAEKRDEMFYTRYGNPTTNAAESVVAGLEGAEDALVFASGMSAVTTSVLAIIKSGDHVVAQSDVYGGTFGFFSRWLPRLGVSTSFVDAVDISSFERAIRPNTRLIYLESPTNPCLKLVDLPAVVRLARERNIPTYIDNTFATPINQQPLSLGIDVVLHSATKYLGGHSDLISGVACGTRSCIAQMREARIAYGGVMDPHGSYLLIRGMKTLALRVARQNASALQIARFLQKHPKVSEVYYPFLESHSQHDLAVRQMKGGGGVLSFDLKGTGTSARTLVENLELFFLAPSLGGVESLATIPALTSHASLSAEERKKASIGDHLVRLSIGVEHVDDLIDDLDCALGKI